MHELSTIFVPSYNFLDVRILSNAISTLFFPVSFIFFSRTLSLSPTIQMKSAHVSPKFSIKFTWKGEKKNWGEQRSKRTEKENQIIKSICWQLAICMLFQYLFFFFGCGCCCSGAICYRKRLISLNVHRQHD